MFMKKNSSELVTPKYHDAGHGATATRMMVIVHGAVSVEMRGHLVCTLRPGDFFGHLSLLVEHPWVSAPDVSP